MEDKNEQGLGGTFFWELIGDTANGELIKALDQAISFGSSDRLARLCH